MIKLRNKKGDLMNNALSLIIVAVGLFLLAYGFYKLYESSVNNEAKNAQLTLDNLMGKIEALEDGQSNDFLIQGFSMKAPTWSFIGFSKDEDRPEKCFLNSCLCICKGYDKSACETNGFCREIQTKNVQTIASMFKGGPAFINWAGKPTKPINYNNPIFSELVKYNSAESSVGPVNYIMLKSNLLQIKVYKDKDNLYLVDPSTVYVENHE